MGDQSKIEWTDATWNPTRGCSKVSEGCRNCYAMLQAIRHSGPGGSYEGLAHTVPGKGPQWTGKVRLVDEALELPLRWRAPRRIFVDSMSDLFHEGVPDEFIDRVWATMLLAPHHTFQILTKRPERAAEYLLNPTLYQRVLRIADRVRFGRLPLAGIAISNPTTAPAPWIWLGTSVEDQAAADERIPHLLRAPAAVRFLSCEPLLGPVVLSYDWFFPPSPDPLPLDGNYRTPLALHWVIAGGESGPGARPFDVAWARSLRNQCKRAGVPFFLKQMGAVVRDRNDAGFDGCEPHEWPSELAAFDRVEHDPDGYRNDYQGAPVRIHLFDRKGGDPDEWPEDLRVREFPITTI